MTSFLQLRIRVAVLALAAATLGPKGSAQANLSPTAPQATLPAASVPQSLRPQAIAALSQDVSTSPAQPLFAFQDADIKFQLPMLMSLLRDNRHEGWVLAAYPDPKTSRPLIGAGFSLDVPSRAHQQLDPLNPNLFLEPSSAQLWDAAGLPDEKLESILGQFNENLGAWQKKKYRRKIRMHDLAPQLTEEEADSLLRISAIQAIHNAKAYCRYFGDLTASQQMALSQMVFQMGVNLEEFTQFLAAINEQPLPSNVASVDSAVWETEHWRAVQSTLISSDWARRYTSRAVNVIAMFDPTYESDPWAAERRVQVAIHPIHSHHRSRKASVRKVSTSSHTAHKKTSKHSTDES